MNFTNTFFQLFKFHRIQEKKRMLKRPSEDDRYEIERKRSSRDEASRISERERRFEPPPPPRFDGPITSSSRYFVDNFFFNATLIMLRLNHYSRSYDRSTDVEPKKRDDYASVSVSKRDEQKREPISRGVYDTRSAPIGNHRDDRDRPSLRDIIPDRSSARDIIIPERSTARDLHQVRDLHNERPNISNNYSNRRGDDRDQR